MGKKTIVYECVGSTYNPNEKLWENKDGTDPFRRLMVANIEAIDYPIGTRLTIEITIVEPDSPDTPRLDADPLKLANEQNGE